MLCDELRREALKIRNLPYSILKSRNRHREVDATFESLSKRLQSISLRLEKLQETCDTNMTLFESLIDLYERGHISINPDSPDNIKDFAKDLFGNMRSLIATYEEAKEASTSDSTIE